MGSCLSLLFGGGHTTEQRPQQQQHAPPQQQQGGSPLSYAAAVAGSALHGLANQLEQHGGNAGGAGGGGAAPAPWRPGAAPAGRPPAANVKFTIENAYVFKVPDGDTFSVDYADNATGQTATSRVRVMGIDSPETAQNFGREAGDIGRALALKKRVTLHVHTTDRYGRHVADVILPNGASYGEEMLRQGAAWHYKTYDKRQDFADLENAARAARIGLWAYARPQEPWVYRKKKREKQNRN